MSWSEIAIVFFVSHVVGDYLLIAVLIALPHLVQDDRRLLDVYIRTVKPGDPRLLVTIAQFVDQSFPLTTLFLVALLAGALA